MERKNRTNPLKSLREHGHEHEPFVHPDGVNLTGLTGSAPFWIVRSEARQRQGPLPHGLTAHEDALAASIASTMRRLSGNRNLSLKASLIISARKAVAGVTRAAGLLHPFTYVLIPSPAGYDSGLRLTSAKR